MLAKVDLVSHIEVEPLRLAAFDAHEHVGVGKEADFLESFSSCFMATELAPVSVCFEESQ